jgi:hypothetical protein
MNSKLLEELESNVRATFVAMDINNSDSVYVKELSSIIGETLRDTLKGIQTDLRCDEKYAFRILTAASVMQSLIMAAAQYATKDI